VLRINVDYLDKTPLNMLAKMVILSAMCRVRGWSHLRVLLLIPARALVVRKPMQRTTGFLWISTLIAFAERGSNSSSGSRIACDSKATYLTRKAKRDRFVSPKQETGIVYTAGSSGSSSWSSVTSDSSPAEARVST
jgi:hypothetical protein